MAHLYLLEPPCTHALCRYRLGTQAPLFPHVTTWYMPGMKVGAKSAVCSSYCRPLSQAGSLCSAAPSRTSVIKHSQRNQGKQHIRCRHPNQHSLDKWYSLFFLPRKGQLPLSPSRGVSSLQAVRAMRHQQMHAQWVPVVSRTMHEHMVRYPTPCRRCSGRTTRSILQGPISRIGEGCDEQICMHVCMAWLAFQANMRVYMTASRQG